MTARTYPGLALAATLLVQMLASLLLTAPSVLAPAVAPTLGLPPERVGVFVGVAYFAAMLSGLWGGQGVARVGAVRVSQVAMGACALGALAAVAAGGHPAALLAAALIIGTAYGTVNPASATLLGHHAPARQRGLFFSAKQTGVPLGVALAGLVFPAALLAFGWRGAVVAGAAVCVLLAGALQPLATRLEPPARAAAPPASHGLAALAVVMRDPPLRRLSLLSLAYACTQSSFITFLVSLLTLSLGHTLAWAAGTLALAQVVSTASRIGMGVVSDRWLDAGRLLGLMGLAMAAACVGLALLRPHTATVWVVAAAVFCAATAMGWNGVLLGELARVAIRGRDLASVAGASQFLTFAGSMSGPVLFGEVIRAGGSYSLAFALLAVVPAAAGLVMLAVHRRDEAAEPRASAP